MKKVPEVGDIITVKEFCFNNKKGGTGLSQANLNFNEPYPGPATIAVVKEWTDYECGQRGWGLPLQTDKELMAYLQRNAAEGSFGDDLEWRDEPGIFIIYWSEFDIIDIKEPVQNDIA